MLNTDCQYSLCSTLSNVPAKRKHAHVNMDQLCAEEKGSHKILKTVSLCCIRNPNATQASFSTENLGYSIKNVPLSNGD